MASPGTEGYRDFFGQLTARGLPSGSPWRRPRCRAPTPRRPLPPPSGALAAEGTDRFDLLVVVRGGGSKADLAAFDAEPVARAVATSPVPVWTGIGHTGDESVADLVANRSCITPTECGRELALRVAPWWEASVATPAELVARRAAERAGGGGAARPRGSWPAGRHRPAPGPPTVGAASGPRPPRWPAVRPRVVGDAHTALVRRAARLGPLALGHVDRVADRMATWRRLLAAYDVDRQLERGYTLTLGA